jgi:hypothetical protein
MSGLSIGPQTSVIIERESSRQISSPDVEQAALTDEAAIVAEVSDTDQVSISKRSDHAAAILRGSHKAENPLSNPDIAALQHEVVSGSYHRPAGQIAEAIMRFEGRLAKMRHNG